MSLVIYKYPLELTVYQTIDMPDTANTLSIQRQGKDYCLWALVDRNRPMQAYEVRLIGTGDPIPEDQKAKLLGSWFRATTQDGPFVWHWFVGLAPKA